MKFNSARAEWSTESEIVPAERSSIARDGLGSQYDNPDRVMRGHKADQLEDFSKEDKPSAGFHERINHWLHAPYLDLDQLFQHMASHLEDAQGDDPDAHSAIAKFHRTVSPFIDKMMFSPVNFAAAKVKEKDGKPTLLVATSHEFGAAPNYNKVIPVRVKGEGGQPERRYRYFMQLPNRPEAESWKPVVPYSMHRGLKSVNDRLGQTHADLANTNSDFLQSVRLGAVRDSDKLMEQLFPLLRDYNHSAGLVQGAVRDALREAGFEPNFDSDSLPIEEASFRGPLRELKDKSQDALPPSSTMPQSIQRALQSLDGQSDFLPR